MNDMRAFSLTEKTAIVTGALGLIGRNHCAALAEAGATVVIADVEGSPVQEFADELQAEHGMQALGVNLDVTNLDSLQAAKEQILSRFGTIDILVNNAAVNDMVENRSGGAEETSFENYPLDLWRRVMDVNVTGVFLCSQVFGAEMARQGGGSIINIASTYGIVAPDQSLYVRPDGSRLMYKSPVYPASKGAVIAFTRFLAAYWGVSGVRVNTLSPGGVENSQEAWFVENYARRTPLGRMAEPSDYKGALVFLASDASRYMTGANLVVDGGFTAW